jgi:hypothetical protein
MDGVVMDDNHPLVKIDKAIIEKKDISSHKDIIMTCKTTFAVDKDILIWAITKDKEGIESKLSAGKLIIIAPSKRINRDIVVVKVKTPSGTGANKSLDDFKRNLKQALITTTIVGDTRIEGNEITIDVSVPANNVGRLNYNTAFAVASKNMIEIDGLAEFLVNQLEAKYPNIYTNHFKLFFLPETLNFVSGESGDSSTRGFSSLGADYAVMFSNHDETTIGHECMHGFGLSHSFNSLAPYTYKAMQTDNIMDYSHWETDPITKLPRTKLTRVSTWYWQWHVLNNNI